MIPFRSVVILFCISFGTGVAYYGFQNIESNPALAGVDFFFALCWTYIAALKISRKENE